MSLLFSPPVLGFPPWACNWSPCQSAFLLGLWLVLGFCALSPFPRELAQRRVEVLFIVPILRGVSFLPICLPQLGSVVCLTGVGQRRGYKNFLFSLGSYTSPIIHNTERLELFVWVCLLSLRLDLYFQLVDLFMFQTLFYFCTSREMGRGRWCNNHNGLVTKGEVRKWAPWAM